MPTAEPRSGSIAAARAAKHGATAERPAGGAQRMVYGAIGYTVCSGRAAASSEAEHT